MAASYLQSSMDKIPEARDPKLIELCINPDGTLWAEFQGDHFMRRVNRRLSPNEIKDLGNQIASAAIGEYLSVSPVIYVDQGARVTVMVDRDLEIF